MMIHYNKKRHSDDADRDSAGLDAGAVVNTIDPDLFFDELPQPFRFISKQIESLISNACDQVDSAIRAQARSMRLSKLQLADLTCLEQVEEDSEIALSKSSLHSIGDYFVAFFSADDQLVLWDAAEMVKLDSIHLGDITVTKINTFEVSPTRFLMAVLIQKGHISVLTIVAVLESKLHVITQQDVSIQDSVACDCLISPQAEFLAIVHSATDDLRCVEIYTLQCDAWFRSLDASSLAANTNQGSPRSPVPNQSQPGATASVTSEVQSVESASASVVASSAMPSSSVNASNNNLSNTVQQQRPSMGSVAGAAESAGPSLAPPSEPERSKMPSCPLSMRFKYPVLSPSSTLSQFIKASDSGDGLCLGTNHLLSANYLTLRQNLHRHRQAQFMPLGIAERLPHLLTVSTETVKRPPLCVWLTNSKFTVAWPEVCSLVVYSAIKPVPQGQKGGAPAVVIDQNEGKAESTWPLSSPVIAMASGLNLQMLGVLLESGNILVLHKGNFCSVGNVFNWLISASLNVTPAPTAARKFSVVESDRIILETASVLPSTAPNFAALALYDERLASTKLLWKFNSLDIGSEFSFVEVFEQWPSVAFLGLPDGALMLCDRDVFSQRLIHLRLPVGYVWPSPAGSKQDARPTLSLSADGRILFALAHYEALISSSGDATNKLFRFDLVSNLPAHLLSRWNPTPANSSKNQIPEKGVMLSTTAIANKTIKQSVCSSADTTERLKMLWAEERDRNKDSRN